MGGAGLRALVISNNPDLGAAAAELLAPALHAAVTRPVSAGALLALDVCFCGFGGSEGVAAIMEAALAPSASGEASQLAHLGISLREDIVVDASRHETSLAAARAATGAAATAAAAAAAGAGAAGHGAASGTAVGGAVRAGTGVGTCGHLGMLLRAAERLASLSLQGSRLAAGSLRACLMPRPAARLAEAAEAGVLAWRAERADSPKPAANETASSRARRRLGGSSSGRRGRTGTTSSGGGGGVRGTQRSGGGARRTARRGAPGARAEPPGNARDVRATAPSVRGPALLVRLCLDDVHLGPRGASEVAELLATPLREVPGRRPLGGAAVPRRDAGALDTALRAAGAAEARWLASGRLPPGADALMLCRVARALAAESGRGQESGGAGAPGASWLSQQVLGRCALPLLESVSLCRCALGDAGFARPLPRGGAETSLAASLAFHPSLRRAELRSNDLGGDSVCALANAIADAARAKLEDGEASAPAAAAADSGYGPSRERAAREAPDSGSSGLRVVDLRGNRAAGSAWLEAAEQARDAASLGAPIVTLLGDRALPEASTGPAIRAAFSGASGLTWRELDWMERRSVAHEAVSARAAACPSLTPAELQSWAEGGARVDAGALQSALGREGLAGEGGDEADVEERAWREVRDAASLTIRALSGAAEASPAPSEAGEAGGSRVEAARRACEGAVAGCLSLQGAVRCSAGAGGGGAAPEPALAALARAQGAVLARAVGEAARWVWRGGRAPWDGSDAVSLIRRQGTPADAAESKDASEDGVAGAHGGAEGPGSAVSWQPLGDPGERASAALVAAASASSGAASCAEARSDTASLCGGLIARALPRRSVGSARWDWSRWRRTAATPSGWATSAPLGPSLPPQPGAAQEGSAEAAAPAKGSPRAAHPLRSAADASLSDPASLTASRLWVRAALHAAGSGAAPWCPTGLRFRLRDGGGTGLAAVAFSLAAHAAPAASPPASSPVSAGSSACVGWRVRLCLPEGVPAPAALPGGVVAAGALGRGAASAASAAAAVAVVGGVAAPIAAAAALDSCAHTGEEERACLGAALAALGEAGGRESLSAAMHWRPALERAAQFDQGARGTVMVWSWERVCVVVDCGGLQSAEFALDAALLTPDESSQPTRTVHVSDLATWELQSPYVAEVSRLESWVSCGAADI